MLSAGIQATFSSNWKPALVGSKWTHSSSDTRKVTSEVISAALRQLRSTASLGPCTTMQNSAPTKGRKVMTERIGQLAIVLSHEQHEVADERGDADQHHEGVVVQVAALEAAQHARNVVGPRRDAVGSQPVDRRAVALLPEYPADRQRRLDEHRVIELVEVPLVVEQCVQRLEGADRLGRHLGIDHVVVVAERNAAYRGNQRQQLHPR